MQNVLAIFFHMPFKLRCLHFLRNTPFFGKTGQERPKMAKMASENPRNGPHMLKTFEIFDFQPKII